MANYELSNRIYELRIQKGLSQKELGAILGVSNKAVSKWETGTAIPKTETLIKLAEVFEISTEELINGVCNDENVKDKVFYKSPATVPPKTPKEINKYFFKVSVSFNLILGLIIGLFLPMVIFIFGMFGFSTDDVYIVLILGNLINTLGYIKLGKYLTEKSGLVGNFNKHKFIYFVVPKSAVAFISAISTTMLFLGEEHIVSYWTSKGLNMLVSFISIVLSIVVIVVLMNNSIEQNIEKSRKAYKTIAIIATISALLGYVVDGITDYMQFGAYNCVTPVEDFLFLCINIAIVWLLCSTKERTLKKEKLTFIILPIISMWGPTVLEILYKISRHI